MRVRPNTDSGAGARTSAPLEAPRRTTHPVPGLRVTARMRPWPTRTQASHGCAIHRRLSRITGPTNCSVSRIAQATTFALRRAGTAGPPT
jgi:hypothetical protein